MTVELVTYCYPPVLRRAYAGLAALVDSFKYKFDGVTLIRQRCRGMDAGELSYPCRIIETEDYPWEDICGEFGLNAEDSDAERATATIPYRGKIYYWKYLLINQFIGLKESTADYMVFLDCDYVLVGDTSEDSWVDRGLRKLQSDPSIFMVGPYTGEDIEGDFKTQNISQVIMLFERQRLLNLNYNLPIPAGNHTDFKAIYVHVFEGRLWRHAIWNEEYRGVLAGPPRALHHDWRADN